MLQRLIILLCFFTLFSQANAQAPDEVSVMFYNVENLFDIRDDSLTRDDEFLPRGTRGWTYTKFQQKLQNIYKVIAAVGEWEPPMLVGLAEVENRFVLEALLRDTPLHRYRYEIVHQDSKDARGIDVALLYRSDQFTLLDTQFISVDLSAWGGGHTREILYVKGTLRAGDTLHYLVNHWPSRYRGVQASNPLRLQAAQTLRAFTDSLYQHNPESNILIAGDFNDNPEEASLQALCDNAYLTNVSQYAMEGTNKHQDHWNTFDQFIVSRNLIGNGSQWQVEDKKAVAYAASWLLEEDLKYLGYKLRRTYVGFRYQGGFSDHLPVYVRLVKSHL